MADSEFTDAMRLRCGVAINSTRTICACGKLLTADRTSDLHLLKCSAASGFTAVHRHAEVVAAAKQLIQRACLAPVVEPAFYEYEDARSKRPDFTVHYGPEEAVAYDVTIVFPDEDGCSTIQGISAAKAASDKHRKHNTAVTAAGHKFQPLAFEAMGHMDSAVDRFISDVVAHIPEWDRKQARLDALIGISSAIARGAARIVRGRVEKIQRADRYAMTSP